MKVAIIRDSHGATYSNDPVEIKYYAEHFELINRTLIGRDSNSKPPHIIHDIPKGYGVEIRTATYDEELYAKLKWITEADWEKVKNFLNTIGIK